MFTSNWKISSHYDSEILNELYDKTKGSKWLVHNKKQLSSSARLIESDERVIEINFSANRLAGHLPSELGDLSSLVSLNLGSNKIKGTIPKELGNLTNLTLLNLSINKFTGPIPPELGNLRKLNSLWLSSNRLTGKIPVELGKLTKLASLNLSVNELTGEIPTELGKLKSLVYCNLSKNYLSGMCPHIARCNIRLNPQNPDDSGMIYHFMEAGLHKPDIEGNRKSNTNHSSGSESSPTRRINHEHSSSSSLSASDLSSAIERISIPPRLGDIFNTYETDEESVVDHDYSKPSHTDRDVIDEDENSDLDSDPKVIKTYSPNNKVKAANRSSIINSVTNVVVGLSNFGEFIPIVGPIFQICGKIAEIFEDYESHDEDCEEIFRWCKSMQDILVKLNAQCQEYPNLASQINIEVMEQCVKEMEELFEQAQLYTKSSTLKRFVLLRNMKTLMEDASKSLTHALSTLQLNVSTANLGVNMRMHQDIGYVKNVVDGMQNQLAFMMDEIMKKKAEVSVPNSVIVFTHDAITREIVHEVKEPIELVQEEKTETVKMLHRDGSREHLLQKDRELDIPRPNRCKLC